MRKLMLGTVLLAVVLPVTAVYAAPNGNNGAINSQDGGQTNSQQKSDNSSTQATKGEGKAKANYMANKAGKAAKKNAEDAIAEGVANGLSVQDAMAEIIQADPNNAAVAVAAAVKADPTNAGAITKFALSKAPSQSTAITRAALDAVKTPEARRVVAAAASESGVPVSVINAQLKDVTNKNGAYEQFSVNTSNDTSTISTVTPASKNTQQETVGTTTGTPAAQAPVITQTASGGGGACDPKKASCS